MGNGGEKRRKSSQRKTCRSGSRQLGVEADWQRGSAHRWESVQADVKPEGDAEWLLPLAQRRVEQCRVDDRQCPVQQADETLDRDGEDGDRRLEPCEDREREDVVEEREEEREPGDCEAGRRASRLQYQERAIRSETKTHERMVKYCQCPP